MIEAHIGYYEAPIGYYESPIGLIEITAEDGSITGLNFVENAERPENLSLVIQQANQQLAEYFAGNRRIFELPLSFQGTEFQKLVWQNLLTIPYGQLVSYTFVAETIGRPDAVRAVGAANGQNPISIVAPCHRVVGSDGNLTGYGGGLWRKEWLLKHEGALLL
jgi:methylated-DNA-[protein]-cysteine S-methyltransferase